MGAVVDKSGLRGWQISLLEGFRSPFGRNCKIGHLSEPRLPLSATSVRAALAGCPMFTTIKFDVDNLTVASHDSFRVASRREQFLICFCPCDCRVAALRYQSNIEHGTAGGRLLKVLHSRLHSSSGSTHWATYTKKKNRKCLR